MTREEKFFDALKDVFVGAKVEGESGYINLMRIKSRYYERGVFPKLQKDINEAIKPFPSFRDELFERLYDFFHRYFSESGSIYFRYTPLHQNVYEKVYTNDKDVVLFWKTHMLYYVKTDRLFKSMEVEVDGQKFFFDASTVEHKKANEKRDIVYKFKEKRKDTLVFTVSCSENGRKTKIEETLRALRKNGDQINEATLERAFRVFEKQSEVDYFINKDAKAFLEEQFNLWLYHYVFSGVSEWAEARVKQLQVLKGIAFKIIAFISQFEDELVKVWNKPKFVLNSNYVITLDRLAEKDMGLIEKLLAHKNLKAQIKEWQGLGMIDESFKKLDFLEKDGKDKRLAAAFRFLPLDTKHFKDLECEILGLFDDLDEELDGRLIKSENYQALRTIQQKFRDRVRCIYIDPPYNTDAGPILYANEYRSSSWVSLMENRFAVAKPVLSDLGIVCVTVDDYQVHELALLLDESFGRDNQLGVAVIRNNPSGRSTVKGFSVCHEYAFFYRTGDRATFQRLPRSEKQLDRFTMEDGIHVDWRNFRKDGGIVTHRSERPKQFYPIYVRKEGGRIRIPKLSWDAGRRQWEALEKPGPGEVAVLPIDENGKERVWSLNHVSAAARLAELQVKISAGSKVQILRRHIPSEGVLPRSWWDKNTYAAREHGSATLSNLFGHSSTFSFAKSPFAVQDCLWISGLASGSNEQVLDFFAGSGTTGHAVINLNHADGGKRKYILVEMEKYFDTVLLPRIKKVVFCDKWKDGKPAGGEGVSHFLKYFQLEQYEDTLRRAKYEEADLFDDPNKDPYHQYVFLRDRKMLDAFQVDTEKNRSRWN